MRTVSAHTLKGLFPIPDGSSIVIEENQDVPDIVKEILDAHQEFTDHYDKIAVYFQGKNISEICNSLYYFLKKNIDYEEETVDDQTTALPSYILWKGKGDCKHYASWAGGVLDALNRKGYNIDWCYRFASYKEDVKEVYHVFVVVNDYGQEYWIDPTPGANDMNPVYILDKKVKKSRMLSRVISGFGESAYSKNVGSALADIATNPQVQQSASNLLSSITNLFTGLLKNITIGDQVPDYPIKSKNTLTKIVTQIQGEFPQPYDVQEAMIMLPKAEEAARIAYSKGGDVNNTYGMIYDQVANTLRTYIKSGGQVTTTNATTSNGPTNNGPDIPAPKSINWMLWGGLGIGALLLFGGNSRRKVSGTGDDTLLLVGLGIGTLLLLSKKKPEQNQLAKLQDGQYEGSILGNQVVLDDAGNGNSYIFNTEDGLRNIEQIPCVVDVSQGKIKVTLQDGTQLQ